MARTMGLALAVSALAGARHTLGAQGQAPVPVVTLPSAQVKSADTFGMVMNVRELPGGKLLVDDGKYRTVKLLTPTLAIDHIVLDSSLAVANTYGNFPLPLIAYPGDSTLFASPGKAHGVLVIDPDGRIARALAMPHPGEPAQLRRAEADNRGRIIWMGFAPVTRPPAPGVPPAISDSAPLLRADLVARRTDTVGYIARPMARIDIWTARQNELSFWQPDPLKSIDEWTVLSDGSLAIVRGHDYRIDWIRQDGATESTPKLPFAWRQLDDQDKQRLVDTVQATWRAEAASNTLVVTAERSPTPWPRRALSGSDDPNAPKHPSFDTTKAVLSDVLLEGRPWVRLPDRPSIEDVFDYYPPIRTGGVLADMDDHLWILPTISKQSKAGELVYDVVSSKGEMLERVRVPLGRYIVGFGRNSVVYVAAGNTRDGFAIERSQLPTGK